MEGQLSLLPERGQSAAQMSDEQRAAVERRRGPLLLAAGAGSGKTSVLAERFVAAVLQDGIAPARILAITFTDRAAAELRERIRARLLALGERAAARDTEAAPIDTFHGFCTRLLRAHALLAGLDPDFAILDEAFASRLRLLAFREALADLIASRGEAAVELTASYQGDRLQTMILSTYAELRSRGWRHPRLPQAPARRSTTLTADALRRCLVPARECIAEAIERRPGKLLQESLGALERADAELHAAPPALDEDASLQQGADLPGWPHSPGVLERWQLRGASAGELAGEACEAYRAALADYAQACADAQAAHLLVPLGELMDGFSARYGALKRLRAALDFDDLELEAKVLLQAAPQVLRSWSERLELVMVDEFQDTNRRQLAILELLERENLFTVGDELQSIYGFRHAEVAIFRERRARLEARGQSLRLSRNFRSRPQLLTAVNAIFAGRLGSSYAPLSAGRECAEAQTAGQQGDIQGSCASVREPSIELLLTAREGWEAAQPGAPGAGSLPAAPAWRQAEARLLAGRIAELLTAGGLRGSDVVILLRSLTDVSLYESALGEQRLSTLASAGSFWSAQAVTDLLSYMRVLANPLDELALYGVLASPLAGLSSDALVLLSRARAGRRGAGALWALVAEPDAELRERLTAPDLRRLQRFAAWAVPQRSSAPRHALPELIERAVAASGYERDALSLRFPERRMANLHKLSRLAGAFEAAEGRDLRGFLTHVDHQRERLAGAEPQAPVADLQPDAVRLMSIHAAKGLEFPVVCLADLGRAITPRSPALLADEQRVGLRVATLDGSAPVAALDYSELQAGRRQAEAEEEERILYVAMTRARDRLICSGAVAYESWPEPRPGGAPIAWIGPALAARLPQLLAGQQGAQAMRVALDADPRVEILVRLSAPADDPRAVARPPDPPSEPAGSADVSVTLHSAAGGPPARAEGAVRAGGGALSYTALAALERCSYRYYLERVLDLGRPTWGQAGGPAGAGDRQRSRPDGRELGAIVHHLLESPQVRSGELPSGARIAELSRRLGLGLGAADGPRIRALLGAVSGHPLALRLERARRVRVEHPFGFLLDARSQLLTGVFDVLAEEPDGSWLIVDYKTDAVAPAEDLGARVQRDYAIQRLLYALAALRAAAPRVEVVHWFLQRPREPVSVSYECSDDARLAGDLQRLLERLESRGFTVSATPHRAICHGCPARDGLCSWTQEQTSREDPSRTGGQSVED